jgi:hypothetical protein
MDTQPDQHSISSKRQFNAVFTPACRIPPEILSAIFEYQYSLHWPTRNPAVMQVCSFWRETTLLTRNPTVMQVCNFWRETALNTPCLWNRIDSDSKEISIDFYHRFRFPVHINWDHAFFPWKDIESAIKAGTDPYGFSQVFDDPARILSLDITAERVETISALLARMDGGPAPLLTSIKLTTRSMDAGYVHVPELEALRLPMLHTLSLTDVAVPWHTEFMRGPHLRFLELSYDTNSWKSGLPVAWYALSVTLTTLAGLPNLENLSYRPLPEPAPGAALQLVLVPHLRTLKLGGSAAACAALMQHMSPARPMTVRLHVHGSDNDDSVAAALWDAVARYWIPNAPAPPNAQVSIQNREFSARLLGTAPGGNEQELDFFKYLERGRTVTHATLRELGPRLARVQTPACLELCVESGEFDECKRFVRGLCALIPRLTLRGTRALECFLSVLEGGGDENAGEVMFGCLRDLVLKTEDDWGPQDDAELGDSLKATNDRVSRLFRGLDRRRASGATALRSLTLINFQGLDNGAVRALLRIHDKSLQVTVRK